MSPDLGMNDARAALAWLIELGADEAIGDAPVNRYALPPATAEAGLPGGREGAAATTAPATAVDTMSAPVAALRGVPEPDAPAAGGAAAVAAAARDLEGLQAALAAWQGCTARRGARTTVRPVGDPGCGLMVLGGAPGREEDRAGTAFAGPEGALTDAMFAAIGRGRDGTGAAGLYLARAVPWRLPPSGDLPQAEIDALRPFVRRHVAMAAPRVVVAMGDIASRALLGAPHARGDWTEADNVAVLTMADPMTLLRHPARKREAWADLLALAAHLRELPSR